MDGYCSYTMWMNPPLEQNGLMTTWGFHVSLLYVVAHQLSLGIGPFRPRLVIQGEEEERESRGGMM